MIGAMFRKHSELLTGLFVASGIIIFVVGSYALLFKKGAFNLRYTVFTVFDSGIGLRQGTEVQFNGVKIGRVEQVRLITGTGAEGSQGRVVLQLSIERAYQNFLTKASVAYAQRDKNLVSDRVINIETLALGGSALQDGDTLNVTANRDIETVLTGITKLMVKMDDLLHSIGTVVTMSQDSTTSVGALLGSRELYDRLLNGVDHVDRAAMGGTRVLTRLEGMSDTVESRLTMLMSRADSISDHVLRSAEQAEKLAHQANTMADRGDQLLQRTDQILAQTAGKMEQAGELMSAVSQYWVVRRKLPDDNEIPLLLNTAAP